MMIFWIMLAVLSIIYGVSVGTAASGNRFFLIWLALGILFFLFAIAAKCHVWVHLSKGIRVCAIVAGCAAVVLFGIVEGLIIRGFAQKGKDNLSYIIVLGAQVYDREPSIVCKYRLDAALDYLENNPDTICIVSGGQGYNEPRPEADVMAEYLIRQGMDEARILREDKSKTTAQNIEYSRALMPPKTVDVGIVTNNFHVYRAVKTAQRQGLTQACGIAAGSTPYYLPHNMLREFLAVIKYTFL